VGGIVDAKRRAMRASLASFSTASVLAVSFLSGLGCSSSHAHTPPIQDGSVEDSTGVDRQTTTDATTTVDATPVTCQIAEQSNLPGVRIHVTSETCTFTLAEVKAGIHIPYEITVDHDVETVPKEPPSSYCYAPGPSGLLVGAVLSGGDQRYCRCDEGLPYRLYCEQTSTVRAGVYASTFEWDGVNWYGPSDTQNPKGKAFPTGIYRLDITAKGLIGAAPPRPDAGEPDDTTMGDLPPFTVSASYAVQIVP
jgi:hypothetical protein